MKKVLVIGSGGREHAIVYQLSRSAQVEKIYCAPGNAGIAQLSECVAITDTDVEQLLAFASDRQIDLCVVGPEASLAAGVADAFRAAGIPVFGHSKAATQVLPIMMKLSDMCVRAIRILLCSNTMAWRPARA